MPRTHDFKWFKIKWVPRYGWTMCRPPAVVVIPLAPDGRIWLAKMSRVPTGTVSWEVPGGAIDQGEDALEAGLREMEEECALVAKGGGELLPTVFELAPGMGTFPHRFVIARGVVPKGRRAVPQRDEGISSVRAFDATRVRAMIRSGKISVLATLTALAVSGFLDGPEERASKNAKVDDARASSSRRSRVHR